MKRLLFFISTFFLVLTINHSVYAAELNGEFTLSGGGNISSLTDDSHSTLVNFNAGETITITSPDGPIFGVYITWDCPVVPWTLTTDNGNISCGNNGFIHEFVAISSGSNTVTINIPDNKMGITSIRIFGDGDLPHDVQVWQPPCEKADIMIISSHADDEILFFGGILPTYTYTYDADIQVVYMTQFWGWSKIREHEKLDGLWESGIKFYPVSAPFKDYKSEDIDTAASQYNYDELVSFVTEQLRRFKPQVVLTHDINGEYGHGYHMLTNKAVTEAVEISADSTKYADSATTYGTWDTPKYYIHLHKENAIKLDYRVPLAEDYAGRCALDIAKEAYTKHVSQQQWWFYVSDTNVYSCADFGLYRTLVGNDTTNDLLCNLKTYKVQAAEEDARLKAEEESRKAEAASKEQASIEESMSLEQASIEESKSIQASIESEASSLAKSQAEKELKQIQTITSLIIITAIFATIIGIVVFSIKRKNS